MLRNKALKEKSSTKAARKVRRKKRATKAKLDQMARAYVMERDGYRCQMAGLGDLTCTPQIQWCHIKSRRFLSTRWLPANSVALCAAHHRFGHDHPDIFVGWWSTTYPDRVVEVKHVFNQGDAPTALEVEEMLR